MDPLGFALENFDAVGAWRAVGEGNSPIDSSGALPGGVKFAWWRLAHGDLVIATRRLDATTVALAADVPGGYGDIGFQVSGLNFPTAGCWQLTGTVGGKTLTFVVNVAAR